MNTQEAIKCIEQMGEYEHFVDEPISKKSVLNIISQIDEPQKVVVPKFVAEWIEKTKRTYNLYGAMGRIKDNLAPYEIMKWFSTNPTLTGEILARAWLDVYEVEQEKLYTVEIPSPYDPYWKHTMLRKGNKGAYLAKVDSLNREFDTTYHLTEAEIRKDFEWAWQWAEEVKEVE